MLRIEHLDKKYKTGDRALKDVNLEVPKGQVMALIGPSGAGKSTLIRCVNRLVEPTSGVVVPQIGEIRQSRGDVPLDEGLGLGASAHGVSSKRVLIGTSPARSWIRRK